LNELSLTIDRPAALAVAPNLGAKGANGLGRRHNVRGFEEAADLGPAFREGA
jgi:hypothetical protein